MTPPIVYAPCYYIDFHVVWTVVILHYHRKRYDINRLQQKHQLMAFYKAGVELRDIGCQLKYCSDSTLNSNSSNLIHKKHTILKCIFRMAVAAVDQVGSCNNYRIWLGVMLSWLP
jgi:hypothetical protein